MIEHERARLGEVLRRLPSEMSLPGCRECDDRRPRVGGVRGARGQFFVHELGDVDRHSRLRDEREITELGHAKPRWKPGENGEKLVARQARADGPERRIEHGRKQLAHPDEANPKGELVIGNSAPFSRGTHRCQHDATTPDLRAAIVTGSDAGVGRDDRRDEERGRCGRASGHRGDERRFSTSGAPSAKAPPRVESSVWNHYGSERS